MKCCQTGFFRGIEYRVGFQPAHLKFCVYPLGVNRAQQPLVFRDPQALNRGAVFAETAFPALKP